MVPTTCSCCSLRSTSSRFRGMMLALCIAGADGVQVRGGKSSGSSEEEGKRVKPNHLDRSFSREDSYCTISRRCTLSRRGKEQVGSEKALKNVNIVVTPRVVLVADMGCG